MAFRPYQHACKGRDPDSDNRFCCSGCSKSIQHYSGKIVPAQNGGYRLNIFAGGPVQREKGPESVYGDQIASKKCYVAAVKSKTKPEQVHWVEVPDAPVLEDVGAEASDKSVEELARVWVEETSDRFFLIGSAMPDLEHGTYSNSLRSHADVFAWTPYEAPGLKPSFACH